MTICCDSREKAKAIKKILAEFEKQGIKYFVSKCYVGDYVSLDNSHLVIDRKQNLAEICTNLCQGHERLKNEMLRATEHNIKIIFLIEHSKDIKCLEDVRNWVNPRLKNSPYAWNGERLYRTMATIQNKRNDDNTYKYNIEFQFCSKNETGARIIELLRGEKIE